MLVLTKISTPARHILLFGTHPLRRSSWMEVFPAASLRPLHCAISSPRVGVMLVGRMLIQCQLTMTWATPEPQQGARSVCPQQAMIHGTFSKVTGQPAPLTLCSAGVWGRQDSSAASRG